MSTPFYLRFKFTLVVLGVLFCCVPLFAQNDAPQILLPSPQPFSMENSTLTTISVMFDRAMDGSTILPQDFLVYGDMTGFHDPATLNYSPTSQTATFSVAAPFQAGETVTTILTPAIKGDNGVPLAASFQWSFYIQAATGTAKFNLDSSYAAGTGPHFVGIGEFNQDSRLDLAVPHSTTHNVYTWLNLGAGIFNQKDIVGVDRRPRALTIGDFDSDDDLDIAVVSDRDNTLGIINNDGNGNFVARDSTYNIGDSPKHVSIGDFNGDGVIDLVTVNNVSNSVSVLLNVGDGNFENEVQFAVGTGPETSCIADFNNDGFLDIVVTNETSNNISLLINDGSANFGAAIPFDVGNRPGAIMAQDFDDDSKIDLVVANRDDNTVSVLINQGTENTFSSLINYDAGMQPKAIATGDWDGDLDADIALVNRDSDSLYVYLNNGQGIFEIDSTYKTQSNPRGIDSADLNGDGVLDLVVASWDSNMIQVFFNSYKEPDNQAPGIPILAAPTDLTFFNPDSAQISLSWSVPDDTESDSLHFVVEIAQNSDFVSRYRILDSRVNSGFSPAPPVDQNTLSVTLTLTPPIPDGIYWWRVKAWDGKDFGAPSESRRFNIDSTLPGIDEIVIANPTAPPNWYNQKTSLAINFGAKYDEIHAKQAVFDFGVLGQDTRNITSGQDQIIQALVNLDGAADDVYTLTVTIIDSAGNQAKDSTEIALDGTSPNIDNIVITNPTLAPNWYNQNTITSIDFGVQYDEANAKHAQFDFGVLGQDTLNIVSGQDHIIQAPVNLVGAADDSYTLSVTIFDSVGLQGADSTEIALDGTPPTGTFAGSPDTTAVKSFTVDWGGSATDGNGTGVAGFDVRVQVNGGNWQQWKTDIQDTSAFFLGEHGQTYGFEAVAFDSIGNRQAFTGIFQSETVVDTTSEVGDVTAPGKPLSLTAAGTNPGPWQNNPDFQINWQPPFDPSGIGRAFYKLDTPPTSDNDYVNTVSGVTFVSVDATKEDGQNLYLWFEDQLGNVDFNQYGFVPMLYDSTAPDIVEIDILNPDYALNWFNQGLTDTAEVEIIYDELHLKQVQLASTELDTTIELDQPETGIDVFLALNLIIQGQSDGLFNLHFTLIDSAGNISLDSTNFMLDNSPPKDTKTSSPDTSRSDSFLVSWEGTGTDSNGIGLSGVYDLQYQVNGGAWQAWHTNFSETSATFTGGNGNLYGFEVAAYDSLGNREAFNDSAESKTFVDKEFQDQNPPSVSHTALLIVDAGQNVKIQAEIKDDNQISEALLFYKKSGDVSYQSVQMTKTVGDSFEYTLTADKIPVMGINYFIQASDGFNFTYHPAVNWATVPNNISVRITGTGGAGLVRADAQPGGAESFFYRMISVPLNLVNKNSLAVLEDDLGAYDAKQWRLFQYKSGDYSEYPDIDSFEPGKAFWLIVRELNKTIDSGPGSTVVSNQPFAITLTEGWNDIGIPFPFAVYWSDIMVVQGDPDSIMGPYTFQDEWKFPNQVSTLSPWEGYSIYSNNPGINIEILPIVATAQQARNLSKVNSEPDWQLGITAVCGSARDSNNFLGVAVNALTEWDKLDYLEPPYIADYVSITFPHDNWQFYNGAFTTDFRPAFEDGQVWHFEVETNFENKPITLTFENIESLPVNFNAILLDKSNYQQKKIDQNSEYVFLPDLNSKKRAFDLVIGTDYFLENSEDLNEIVPKSFFMSQNYPNPFNAGTNLTYHVSEPGHVNIQVFNILGQEVRELISKRHVPGVYRIHWDGTSDNGKEVSTGVFIIKFEAEKFQQIRKVILVR